MIHIFILSFIQSSFPSINRSGSVLFVFLLTAVGNLEKSMFGSSFETKLPEVYLIYLPIQTPIYLSIYVSINLSMSYSLVDRSSGRVLPDNMAFFWVSGRISSLICRISGSSIQKVADIMSNDNNFFSIQKNEKIVRTKGRN